MSRLKLLRELEEVRQKKMKDEENAERLKIRKKQMRRENKRTAAGTGGGNVRGSGRYADTNRKAV